MNSASEQGVQRAIESIYRNVGEQITIEDMARTAMFSKFHFTRLFQRATGVSPGRFLSAVRLQEAKKLLLSTSLSVTDISHRVGYNSVGTFSSRFKRSVGLSPTAYRELGGFAPQIHTDGQRYGARTAVVHGQVSNRPDDMEEGPVFMGLFPDTIPQGSPVRCTVLERPGSFRLEDVPEGSWHLLVQSVRPGDEEIIGTRPPTVATHGPIRIRPGAVAGPLEMWLRPMRALDPPILLALLDARRVALSGAAS
ncbi:helix-turn-helix transcriptional regulator [Actinomadura sp. BRA 177]|uniref:helix-turn-helix transcriptional regulator n=1 Tax=Actinomadura sp. BRA 177 TaxID=2745202 RepID=UPI0028150B9E|nr:helix-turn-helix transcriptional regulator [Actinomadura sp. BRA 177]